MISPKSAQCTTSSIPFSPFCFHSSSNHSLVLYGTKGYFVERSGTNRYFFILTGTNGYYFLLSCINGYTWYFLLQICSCWYKWVLFVQFFIAFFVEMFSCYLLVVESLFSSCLVHFSIFWYKWDHGGSWYINKLVGTFLVQMGT